MSDRLVTVDIEQRIAWVTFNRPAKKPPSGAWSTKRSRWPDSKRA